MRANHSKPEPIERCDRLSSKQFISNYVKKAKPVIISGVIDSWKALSTWSPDYFKRVAPALAVPVKEFIAGRIKTQTWKLGEFADFIERANTTAAGDPPPYCHDVPIFGMVNSLIDDVQPFPLDYFPKWYWYKWWRYVQFFIGPRASLTPLHFDCLLTNNLFFQILGRKKFTIFSPEDARFCYRHSWRWFEVNPECPDFDRYPLFANATPRVGVVHPGDIVYLPPGTLHHVRSLDTSISFNIDWHTECSALKGVAAGLRGMPLQNVFYNAVSSLGLVTKIPARLIYPFYKSYLNYIS